jgi:hypothetical protein
MEDANVNCDSTPSCLTISLAKAEFVLSHNKEIY